MTNEEQEKQLIEAFREMKKIYGDEDLLLICRKSYQGYNLQTGRKVRLVEEEHEDD